MADRNLLEAFSEQLARNLQRSILNKKEMPHHTWKGFLSAQSARNRADTVTLLDNMMREQTYTTVASSYLKEAHAIAYLDGSIAYLNRKMRHLAKIDHSELSQLTLLDLLEHFKTDIFGEPRLAVRKVLQSGESYTCELDFPDEKLTLDLQISLVKVPEREQSIHETSAPMKPACLLITLRDISAVKENAKLRSDMASLMSHELRTPITSIKGFAELLLMDDSMNPESREFLAIIDNEAERLSKMLTTFLSVSNLEQSDKQEFVKTPVRLDHVVKRVVEEMGESAKQKRIRLVEQSRADIPPVAADKGMIAKVVQNLIDNAIKYSPEKTAVIISTILEAEFLRVTVEDRGYGIAPSEQQKIFEKFYRISRDGMDKEAESTGLGLSFVKEAVEQHGGSVEVESEPQQGSKFSFTIPRL
jgi:signal transduction histidine kinase